MRIMSQPAGSRLAIPMPLGSVSSAWRQALPLLLLLLAAMLLLYRETAVGMVSIWARSETFTHAFVVPPIVLWLLWRQRRTLVARAPQPTAWALLPVAAAALAWLLGDLAAVNAVTQLALVALLVLAVPAVLGMPVARAAMFPLGFLFFAVPIGEFLLPQLMRWTADFTVAALRLSGIPVFQEGQNFVIPSGRWSVVEACSGVRYLMASFMVGTLFAYLSFRSLRHRLIFVAVSIIVPIVANWLRAYLIVLLGHLSDNRIATGVDHLLYGWVFFGVVILLLFWIGGRWADPPLPAGEPQRAAVVSAGRVWPAAAWISAAVVLLAAAPHAVQWWADRAESSTAPRLVAPAAWPGGWHAAARTPADWTPAALPAAAAELNANYAQGDRAVGLYVAYFRQQQGERKLVGADAVLGNVNNGDWVRVADVERQAGGAAALPVRAVVLQRSAVTAHGSDDGMVLWQTYWVNGRFTTSEAMAKAYIAFDRLLGRGDDAALLVFSAPGSPSGGEAALRAFVQDNLSAVEALLAAVREQRR